MSIEERKKIKNKFFLNSLFEYVKENSEKNLKILLFNDNNFFLYNNIILVHIIEQILMKNYDKKDVVLIGDRLLTDIKLANNYNIMSILVDPITNHNFILVKIMKKLKEEPLYRELEKKKILIRGRYYG